MEKIFYKGELRLKLIPNFVLFFFDDLQLKRRAPYISLGKSLGCLGDKKESAL